MENFLEIIFSLLGGMWLSLFTIGLIILTSNFRKKVNEQTSEIPSLTVSLNWGVGELIMSGILILCILTAIFACCFFIFQFVPNKTIILVVKIFGWIGAAGLIGSITEHIYENNNSMVVKVGVGIILLLMFLSIYTSE